MGRITQRALTPVRAARRRETLEITPTKKATRRWATLPPPRAPGLNPLGWTMVLLSQSWSSVLKWKMRRCQIIALVTRPPMRPGSAAPQRAPIGPHTCPKQWAPDTTGPGSALQQPELRHFRLVCFLIWAPVIFEGIRGPAAEMEDTGICSESTSGFSYECVLSHFISLFFFFFEHVLPVSVFGVVCPKPKLTHDECLKECQNVLWYIFIIFNFFPLEQIAQLSPFCRRLPQCSVCIYVTTSFFLPYIVQYYLRLRGQGENCCHVLLPVLVCYSYLEVFTVGPLWIFISMVLRAFVSHSLSLNGVCCQKNKCIRYCQTIWVISYHFVWHFQCTELVKL